MDTDYIKNIADNLIKRLQYRKLPHEYELKRVLHFLDENEKKFIKKRILEEQYDIGTFSVIKILKSEGILSITDFLENIPDEYEKLQIITDLVDDSAKSVKLLIEVLQSGNKFQAQIDEALSNYVEDLLKHPELIKTELILSTQKSLPTELFLNSILKKFISHLMHKDFLELTEVITQQKDWKDQFKNYELVSNIFESIMPSHSEFIVKEILSVINEEVNWFYMLLIINFMRENYAGYADIKKFISDNFKKFKTSNDINSLYKSIILARQLFHYSLKESTYKVWVKNNFGDLKYSLKESETFCELLQSLQNLTVYENDPEILKLHIACQIPAPSKMYSTVLEYKEILKSKEEILNQMDVS